MYLEDDSCTDMSTTGIPLRERIAAELRAEMARQQRTGVQLAQVLKCSQQTASRRMIDGRGLDLDELPLIAEWLGVDVMQLLGCGTPVAVSA